MSNYLKAMGLPKTAKPKQVDDSEAGQITQAIKAAVMPEVAAQVKDCLRDLPAMVREEVQATASAQLNLQARRHAANAVDELRRQQAPMAPAGSGQLETRASSQQQPQAAPDSPLRPAVPQARPSMPVITLQRGADGKINAAHIGSRVTLLVERDAAGKAVRMVPQEN